jgi:hypothetical protein
LEKLRRENQELRMRNQGSSVNSENTRIETTSPSARREPGTFPVESPANSDASSNHYQDLVKSVRNVVVEPSRQPQFLGQSSGITLARLVLAAIRVEALPSSPLFSEQRSYDPSSSAPAAEASLPPRHAADHLVDVYFQYRTPHMPIMERSQVEEAIESAYLFTNENQPSERAIEKDIFTTYMIFAIALCDISNPGGGGRPIQSEGCFRSAIGWIEKVITYSKSDLDTLRAILLLAQFVASCPARGSLWHLVGIALRLCVDIGLHSESEEQSLGLDPQVLHERRRLWYSTYHFDRFLCVTLGRPLGITDESTSVPLPDPWRGSHPSPGHEPNAFDIHNLQSHNHLFTLAKLESEIKHVLHSQAWTPTIAYPRIDYSVWIKDFQPRLQDWYRTIPPPSKADPSSIFAYQPYWDYIYNCAILLLYRPSSIDATTEESYLFFEASCNLIASIKTLQREGRVGVLWKSVHHLFMAGLGIIYALWQSPEIRGRFPVGKSISTLQSCASTLSAITEGFPGATGCRDAFDTLSSATVDWLVSHNDSNTHDDRREFEKQMGDLLQQLQPPREGTTTANENSSNMSALLSTENFAFSEMLSTAAQWPEFEDMNFTDIASGSMIGPGANSSYTF